MCKSIRNSCFFLSFFYKLLVFSFAFVFYCPVIVSAAQVTLEWDENSEADLAGYRIYCRQEGHNYDYYNPVWDGVETTCTVYNLDDNTTYYLVARAFNVSGNESGNSNEVYFQLEYEAELDRIEIEGPVSVYENSSAGYTCRAYYINGASQLVDPDTWEVVDGGEIADLSSVGLLTTFEVDSDEICEISASYAESDIEVTATYDITIRDTDISEVIVDDGDAGTSYTGWWGISGGTNPYGTDSLWTQGGSTYTWEFHPAVSGYYEVSMWWSSYPTGRCTSVPVEIYDGDTWIDSVEVNQKTNGGQWNVIGTYVFNGTARVVIISEEDCTTIADAVRLVK